MSGQARPRHGRRERSFDRLGNCADSCRAHGAELAFTYQGEALGKRVMPLAASLGSKLVLPATSRTSRSVDKVFATLAS